MQTVTHTYIVGYVTDSSNDVNMLKSIVRFARQHDARWMLVHLESAKPATEQPVAHVDRESLKEKCRALGGECQHLDLSSDRDALKLQLFEITVRAGRVTHVLIDDTVSRHPDAVHFKQQLEQALDSARFINIENKNVFLGLPRRALWAPMQRFKAFFLRVCTDVIIGLLFGLFAVLITYSTHYALNHYIAPVDDSYTYMIFVLFANLCALQAGIWGGVMCTLVTSLSANYFFIEPYYQFKLSTLSDAVNWLTLVITSSVTSIISALMIVQFRKSHIEEQNLSLLLDINTTPLKHKNVTMLLQDLKNRLTEHLRTDVVFFVPTLINDNKLELFADQPVDTLHLPDGAIVERIWLDMKQGYIYSHQNDPAAPWVYLPLATLANDVGVLAVKRPADSDDALQPAIDYKKLSDMIAVILEYINLDQEMHARDIIKEKDKLRTHILSSVSHDLKTPLASIIGSLGLYLSSALKLKESQIKALIDNAYSEANRLDGFITNILTMTKVEADLVKFRKEQIRPQQLLTGILDKIRWKLPEERVVIENSDFRDVVTVDVAATELAVSNLLDNAVRHAPADTPIALRFADADNGFTLSVVNKGQAIPSEELETIFDKYARLQREDSQQAATGLGLALSRGLMNGQGGTIEARNLPEGVAFVLYWPES